MYSNFAAKEDTDPSFKTQEYSRRIALYQYGTISLTVPTWLESYHHANSFVDTKQRISQQLAATSINFKVMAVRKRPSLMS